MFGGGIMKTSTLVWIFFFQVMVLALMLCCATVSEACLQCDRSIRSMHEEFTLTGPTPAVQIDLQKINNQAYANYKNTSLFLKGVIDPTTLYRVKTEYQSEFNSFLKKGRTGSITMAAITIMDKGRQILKKHLEVFIRDGLCPNKCGLLQRRVMDCITCNYKMHICPSPSGREDCGEYPVVAKEEGQAVLDCYQPWHSLLLVSREYHYSWAPAVPRDKLSGSDFKNLVVMDDAFMVLNQLRLDEQGRYKCSLRAKDGTLFYQVTYLLKVTPKLTQTSRPIMTLPSLAPGDFQHSVGVLMPLMAVVTTLSLAGSLFFAYFLGKMLLEQRTKGQTTRRKDEEATCPGCTPPSTRL
ncbi:izumo sperm-egg fusion protein 1 isoform X2 [Entelurus aequoreus]|uniref:izumo sperm-egg fusion protein 1 isoform X2 n=1 Tax=Entelurus aequoreus TaxID=161455 RepID=UPI002B1DF931|nr:izumo sperm-egg fusion protein 1 isoform X2 [Entelurus aequoreus]